MIVSSANKADLLGSAGCTIKCTKFMAQPIALAFVASSGLGAQAQTLPVIPTLDHSTVAIAQLDSSCIARVTRLDDVPDCRLVLQQYKTKHDNKKQILDKHCWNLHILDLATRSAYAFKGWPLGTEYDNWAAEVRNQKAFLCASISRTRQNHRNAIWDYKYFDGKLKDKENAFKYGRQIDAIGPPVIK